MTCSCPFCVCTTQNKSTYIIKHTFIVKVPLCCELIALKKKLNKKKQLKIVSLAPHSTLSSYEGDEVLWVRLVIVEHNKHGRVGEHIHHTVETVLTLCACARWGNPHVFMAQCV